MLGVRGNHLFPQDKYRLNYNLYFYSFPSLYWGKGYENGSNDDNESDYDRFQAQVKVDFMTRVARNFYIGPMAVFDYVYGHDFEKVRTVGRNESTDYQYKPRILITL